MFRDFSLKGKIQFGLFWSWNLIFLAFMVLGFAPRMLPELITAVQTNAVPITFLIYGLILSLVPVTAIVLGLTVLKKQPARLFALGYVVEGPLMLILAIRFFLIRQATPGFTFVLVVAFLGLAAFLWHLLDPEIEKRSRWVAYLRLVGLTLMLITSLYAALWIAFYAIPLTMVALEWLRDTLLAPGEWIRRLALTLDRDGWIWLPYALLGFLLAVYTATLFVLAPLAVPILSFQAWRHELKLLSQRVGLIRPLAATITTIALSVLFFLVSNQQPQREVFALLDERPGSVEEAISLLEKEEIIRTGLLNAYLAPFRYMSSQGEVSHVRDIYEYVFGMSMENAYKVQQVYEGVARPLLYEPVHPQVYPNLQDNRAFRSEPQEAALRYQEFFDTTIVDGEREHIVNAVRTTWSADRATAAWQAVDDREVLLARQEINIEEHGDWAEVELYEVYENQTVENQEVIYYFNLPEAAVITGVWLGESPDRAERYEFRVAPRGAAQTVYREEVRRNVDPALLEQIGPRQYRLRIFPVPAIGMRWDSEERRQVISHAPQLHMWLTYGTFAQGDAWPLPRLAEWHNVYWDDNSERVIQSKQLDGDTREWLPNSAPVTNIVEPLAHRMDFPEGRSVFVNPVAPREMTNLPYDLHYAVVLDRSYSMVNHAEEVRSSLGKMEQMRAMGASIDVYLTASKLRGESPEVVSLVEAQLEEIIYLGGQNSGSLLAQFSKLNGGRTYDAVLVFTDGSGYELGEYVEDIPIPSAPVWMVHFGSEIPLGYDDITLEAIQASGGGVSGSLDEALTRLAISLDSNEEDTGYEIINQDILDGYVFTVLATEQVDHLITDPNSIVFHQSGDEFGALAARRLILAETANQRGSIQQLETLDQLHLLAKEYGIVTPYSSMIVLVNELQEKKLDRMESEGDRFEREYEDLGETTPQVETPLSGVPEPHEWLLIGLAVTMLAWYAYRKRFAYQIRY